MFDESLLRTWWHDRVDYRGLVAVLEFHSAVRPVKFMIGAGGAVMSLVTILSMMSHIGPRNAFFAAGCTLIVALTAMWALRWWLLPWPGRAESLLWCAGADLAITFGAVAAENRLYGALVTTLLAVPGLYVGAFHGQRVLAAHVGWTSVSILALVVLLAIDDPAHTGAAAGDYRLGAAIVLISVSLNVIGLPTAQFCRWLWRLNALIDPLTMLLNRRGLDYYLWRYLTPGANGSVYAATLDLDRFKIVNDTFGHPAGDEVLRRAAAHLRAAADADSLVARTGGEEFVVVGRLREEPAVAVADRLRRAVETMPGLPITITASVGIAVVDTSHTDDPSTGHRVLRCSDAAMYRAKRRGGNAVAVAEPNEWAEDIGGGRTEHGAA
ncbi:GGDEF domain-containing protein [Nocardia sp. CDC159]|uniref:GGDEF domain-containing protein n=1 Tax=Nocardia pulmonis TaxID=2951408 RepID=A0A9X2E0K3_9NOCA|nr:MULTISPECIES: GGDEF domain-containing protein [Nocardia]MCM6771899.1 GGDEF domain-containing protein [Nocardia pulmonis]MCM6785443.1 GGDEF domain-containing protein [Nocardia sp. CDC159]